MTDEQRLTEIIARIIDSHGNVVSISPHWIAIEAMRLLDPEQNAPMLVYGGCNLHIRQIARSLLRKKYEPEDSDSEQHALFPELQKRYPIARTARNMEPEYVLLERLNASDIDFNVARLRSEARAKLKHADALEAYGNDHSRSAA